MTKYLDPPIVGIGETPQIPEWIKSKGLEATEILSLNGGAICLHKWQNIQSKVLDEIEPRRPLEMHVWVKNAIDLMEWKEHPFEWM